MTQISELGKNVGLGPNPSVINRRSWREEHIGILTIVCHRCRSYTSMFAPEPKHYLEFLYTTEYPK